MDVESNPEFISCCGPDEWVVCNCLSEHDGYRLATQAENNIESTETEELGVSSNNALAPEATKVLPPAARESSGRQNPVFTDFPKSSN